MIRKLLRYKNYIILTVLFILVFYRHIYPYFTSSKRYVGVYFYVWYRHPWDDAIVDVPVIGKYDSSLESTIEWQLRLMQEAGIDFVIISWWGAYDKTDGATFKVFEVIEKKKFDIKACIMVEPHDDKIDYREVYDYIYDRYAKRDSYFKYKEKPLLMFFENIPSYVDSRFTVRTVGVGSYDWYYWLGVPIVKNKYASVIPRYDNYFLYLKGYTNVTVRIDENLTEGIYDLQWRVVIQKKHDIEILAIVSWNEYYERTMIEPHYDYTADVDPYYLYEKTKEYIKEFKS